MLQLYSNIEYNLQGDTYFARDDEKNNAHYRVYSEYDCPHWMYTMQLYEDLLGMPATQTNKIGKQVIAESPEDAALLIGTFIGNLVDLATSGRLGFYELIDAWNSLGA